MFLYFCIQCLESSLVRMAGISIRTPATCTLLKVLRSHGRKPTLTAESLTHNWYTWTVLTVHRFWRALLSTLLGIQTSLAFGLPQREALTEIFGTTTNQAETHLRVVYLKATIRKLQTVQEGFLLYVNEVLGSDWVCSVLLEVYRLFLLRFRQVINYCLCTCLTHAVHGKKSSV